MNRTSATEICETFLRSEIKDCEEKGILRSEVVVARRLLSRSLELTDAYSEIDHQLRYRPHAVETCLKAILCTPRHSGTRKSSQRQEMIGNG